MRGLFEENSSIHGVFLRNRLYLGRTFYSFPSPLHTQPTLSHSVYLPAVTYVLTFQNAWKMTSRWCIPGRVDSAKKHHVYYYTSLIIWLRCICLGSCQDPRNRVHQSSLVVRGRHRINQLCWGLFRTEILYQKHQRYWKIIFVLIYLDR